MTTLRHIIDEIVVTLKQTYDDAQIQPIQIAYLTILTANDIKSKHIVKRSSGAFLKGFPDIPVFTVSSNSSGGPVKNRKFIYLPQSVYDIHMDRGIDFISYTSDGGVGCPPRFTQKTFTRTTQKESHRLYYTKYETPSPSNPFFYRVGDLIYFLGIEKINVDAVEAGLFTTLDPVDKIDIDKPLEFPDELVRVLRVTVLDAARFILMVPDDRTNDGNNDLKATQVPTQKLVSVNQQQPDNGQ